MKKNKTTIQLVIFAVIVLGIVVAMNMVVGGAKTAGKYDDFSKCMADKGVKFYGAFWCPHCQAQERALGASRQKLEKIGLYVECSTADGQSQTPACKALGIEGYPTWVFPDG
jgi:thiol-disulfide isomerase/thioredoxin